MRVLAIGLALLAAACGGGTATAGRPGGEVVVLAASSLSAAFADEAGAFQRAHPELRVRVSFAGSQALAAQVAQGAPADVFASADEANMDRVSATGLAVDPRVFATNRLVIAVAKGNPKGVRGLADLGRKNVAVVLCAPAVPCGGYSKTVLGAAGVSVVPVSQEQDVKGVVAKVALGEADAGICYRTDATPSAGVDAVAIPDSQNVVARYPVAALKAAPNPSGASLFISFLTSGPGQDILGRDGFGPP